jgi:hypothetical protein
VIITAGQTSASHDTPKCRCSTKADILSLTAFEIGLFGWMALMSYVFFPTPMSTLTAPCTGFSCNSA